MGTYALPQRMRTGGVGRGEEVPALGLVERDADGVGDHPRLHLRQTHEPGHDRQPGGVGRRPPQRAQAVRGEVEHRAVGAHERGAGGLDAVPRFVEHATTRPLLKDDAVLVAGEGAGRSARGGAGVPLDLHGREERIRGDPHVGVGGDGVRADPAAGAGVALAGVEGERGGEIRRAAVHDVDGDAVAVGREVAEIGVELGARFELRVVGVRDLHGGAVDHHVPGVVVGEDLAAGVGRPGAGLTARHIADGSIGRGGAAAAVLGRRCPAAAVVAAPFGPSRTAVDSHARRSTVVGARTATGSRARMPRGAGAGERPRPCASDETKDSTTAPPHRPPASACAQGYQRRARAPCAGRQADSARNLGPTCARSSRREPVHTFGRHAAPQSSWYQFTHALGRNPAASEAHLPHRGA